VLEAKVHSLRTARHVTDIRNIGLAAGITLARCLASPRAARSKSRCGCGARLLRALRRRHAAARAALRRHAGGIDALVNALGEALAQQA
jgi:beta-alanine--pyruvate transaminase